MTPPLHLFEGYGIELEYMIVQTGSLDVCPLADVLLRTAAGAKEFVSDVSRGPMAWSNELVMHVVEFKTNGPQPALAGLAEQFHAEARYANSLLADEQALLMPSAMHPWMNPDHEMRIWPHDFSEVYQAFNRIFDCHGHGWANLQSMHVNLPFCGDEEFGRLHAAVRLVLPLLPALAASSPLKEGQLTGKLDTRLEVYRGNSRKLRSVAGEIIPERCFSRADYDAMIFQPMYAEIAPFDPAGVLRDEFLNSRGAIARFSRGAIEIRLLDVQECPRADLAIAALVCRIVERLCQETWSALAEQQAVEIEPLARLLGATIEQADRAMVEPPLLAHFGCGGEPMTAGALWRRLLAEEKARDADFAREHGAELDVIVEQGPLARRIVAALADESHPQRLREVYASLAECLAENRMFVGQGFKSSPA